MLRRTAENGANQEGTGTRVIHHPERCELLKVPPRHQTSEFSDKAVSQQSELRQDQGDQVASHLAALSNDGVSGVQLRKEETINSTPIEGSAMTHLATLFRIE